MNTTSAVFIGLCVGVVIGRYSAPTPPIQPIPLTVTEPAAVSSPLMPVMSNGVTVAFISAYKGHLLYFSINRLLEGQKFLADFDKEIMGGVVPEKEEPNWSSSVMPVMSNGVTVAVIAEDKNGFSYLPVEDFWKSQEEMFSGVAEKARAELADLARDSQSTSKK